MAKAQAVPACPQIRIYQRGPRWYFDVRVGGRRIRQPGGRTQAEAEAAGAQFLASGAQRFAPGTVGAVLDAWLAYQGTYGRKERTVKTSANSAARLKRYFDAQRPLEEVDTDALAAFVHWRQSGPRRVGAYAINRDLATLRAAWRHAHEDRKAPAPPKFRTLETNEPNPKPVTREEFALLMLHGDKRTRAISVLAAVLGLRNSEIRRLLWRNVDLAAKRVRVDMLHAKNRSERLLPIPESVVGILVEHRAAQLESGPNALVFTNRRGEMFTDYGLLKVAHRVWERAGLLDDRPGTKVLQDLRATAATFMVEARASTETLRTNLGWKSREVVERYVKAFEHSQSRAIEAVADALL